MKESTQNELYARKVEILKSKSVEIITDDEFIPLKESRIEYFTKIQGFSFPEDILSFYRQCNGFYFGWKIQDTKGYFLFPTFIGMFSNLLDAGNHKNAFEGVLWKKGGYSKKEIEERKQHKVLEFFEGDSPCTTVKFNQDQSYQLFHVDSEIYPIPLSLGGYVNMVADLYGFGNFRYYLHEEGFYHDPLKYCPELKKLHEIFPSFNPDSLDFNLYLTIP